MLTRRTLLTTAAAGLVAAIIPVAAKAIPVVAKPPALGLQACGIGSVSDVLCGFVRLRDVRRIYLSEEDFAKYLAGPKLDEQVEWLQEGSFPELEALWPGDARITLQTMLDSGTLIVQPEQAFLELPDDFYDDIALWNKTSGNAIRGREIRPD